MLIHAYLDATESEQALPELKTTFETFALSKGHTIGYFYSDREIPKARSSLFRLLRDKGLAIASQAQPASNHAPFQALFSLLRQARPNDVLLVESARLLGRLSSEDWRLFREKIRNRKVRVVSMDVKASWVMVTGESAMAPMAEQLTGMLLDTVETVSISERAESRRRQLDGIARARSQGKYKGRPVDRKKHETIHSLLQSGYSWSKVCAETGASRSTVARVVKMKARSNGQEYEAE